MIWMIGHVYRRILVVYCYRYCQLKYDIKDHIPVGLVCEIGEGKMQYLICDKNDSLLSTHGASLSLENEERSGSLL